MRNPSQAPPRLLSGLRHAQEAKSDSARLPILRSYRIKSVGYSMQTRQALLFSLQSKIEETATIFIRCLFSRSITLVAGPKCNEATAAFRRQKHRATRTPARALAPLNPTNHLESPPSPNQRTPLQCLQQLRPPLQRLLRLPIRHPLPPALIHLRPHALLLLDLRLEELI